MILKKLKANEGGLVFCYQALLPSIFFYAETSKKHNGWCQRESQNNRAPSLIVAGLPHAVSPVACRGVLVRRHSAARPCRHYSRGSALPATPHPPPFLPFSSPLHPSVSHSATRTWDSRSLRFRTISSRGQLGHSFRSVTDEETYISSVVNGSSDSELRLFAVK